jgi:iron complex outermembrane receptor protein
MIFKFIGLILLGWSNIVYSQVCNLRINGTVKDLHDGMPVANAKIFIKGTSISVETDTSGHYTLGNICQGNYQMICLHHIGCEPVKKDVFLLKDTTVNFSLEYHLLELDETFVVHYVLDNSPISVVKLSELDKLNGAGKTLGEQLKRIPGVQTLSTGGSISKPVIHGMHSNRVVLMNNGVRQEGQQWGSEHAPEIDPFLSAEISVVKGASAVKYGPEAISGVILLAPAPWRKKTGWAGELSTGYFSNGTQGYLSGKIENSSSRIKGLSIRGHGTLKKSGNISAPNYVMGNTGLEEYNFSIASRYIWNKNTMEVFYSQFNTRLGIFSGSHIGNLSDLQAAFEADEPLVKSSFTYDIVSPRQQINHDLFKAKAERAWNSKQNSELTYSRQTNDRFEFDVAKGFGTIKPKNEPDFRLLLTTHSIDFIHKSKWTDRLETQIGSQFQFQKNARAGRYLVPNFYKNMGGIFAVGNYHINNWDFEAGARYDYVRLEAFYYKGDSLVSPIKSFGNTSATLGISRSFGHHWLTKLNIGTAWRPPSISELYSNGLHHGAAAIEVGNSNLRKEQSNSIQFGGQYKSKRLSANIDLYHIYFSNYIYLKPNGVELTIKGAFPSFIYEAIKANYSGIDFSIEYHITERFSYVGKYNMVRVLNLVDNSFLIGIPTDRLRNGLMFNLKEKKQSKLNILLNSDYVFKQNRFEANADYVDPPSDYLLFNMEINYVLQIKEKTIQFALTADNLLNKSYRDYMNRFRYFTDEMGRNIGVKINFKF